MYNMERKWAMPNKDTFSIKPIHEIIEKYVNKDNQVVVDPFSNGKREWGTITNDLNPDVDADYHMDAHEFMQMLDDNSADVVLYDPPYSVRQVSECYHNFGKEVTSLDTSAHWRARHLDEIKRITKKGGLCLSFGWNSNGVGKKRGFKIVDVLLVAHGGSHNDTIVTIERKVG